jgi:hypothetical protein
MKGWLIDEPVQLGPLSTSSVVGFSGNGDHNIVVQRIAYLTE